MGKNKKVKVVLIIMKAEELYELMRTNGSPEQVSDLDEYIESEKSILNNPNIQQFYEISSNIPKAIAEKYKHSGDFIYNESDDTYYIPMMYEAFYGEHSKHQLFSIE